MGNPRSNKAIQYYSLKISLLESEAGGVLDRNSLERDREREVVFNTSKELGTFLLIRVVNAVLQK